MLDSEKKKQPYIIHDLHNEFITLSSMLSQFRKIFVIVAAEKHVHKIGIEELRTTIMLLEFIKHL